MYAEQLDTLLNSNRLKGSTESHFLLMKNGFIVIKQWLACLTIGQCLTLITSSMHLMGAERAGKNRDTT